MKVVVIGMTNRPLTYHVIKGLISENMNIGIVLLQKRFSNRGNIASFIYSSIKNHGFRFVAKRMLEILKKRKINIAKLCLKNNVDFIEVADINSNRVKEKVENIKPDVIVLAGPPIIKKHIFSQAKLYTINVHRSLLPKYAGLDAIFWALFHNEKEVGATVHTVNEGIDTGDIIIQKRRRVEKNDNLESLTNWYYKAAPQMVIEALEKISSGDTDFIKQDKSKRTYFTWPTKEQRNELRKKLS